MSNSNPCGLYSSVLVLFKGVYSKLCFITYFSKRVYAYGYAFIILALKHDMARQDSENKMPFERIESK